MRRLSAFPLFFAYRLITQHYARSFISAVLVIAFSLVPLVFVSEFSGAMVKGLVSRLIETGSYHFQAYQFNAPPDALFELADTLVQEELVVRAQVEQRSYALAFSPLGRQTVQLRAVPGDFYTGDVGLQRFLTLTGASGELGEDEAFVGEQTALKLGLEVGDTLRFLMADAQTTNTHRPRIVSVQVAGLVATGYQDLDKSWVFIHQRLANGLFSPEQSEAFVGIKVAQPHQNLAQQQQHLQDIVPRNTIVYDWQVLNSAHLDNFNTTRTLLIFVLFLIVVVASLNTSSMIQMLYLEHTATLAVLKAMGITGAQLRTIFVLVGVLTGLCGAVLGVGIGALLALTGGQLFQTVEVVHSFFTQWGPRGAIEPLDLSFYLNTIEVQLHVGRLLFIVLGTVMITLVASLIPAHQASLVRPWQLLKKV